MKKIVSLLLVLLLVVPCALAEELDFSGAVEQEEVTDEQVLEAMYGAYPPSDLLSQTLPEDKKTVTILSHYSLGEAKEYFNKLFGGEIVEVICGVSEYASKLTNMIASGNAPDLVVCESSTNPSVAVYANAGLVQPFDPYIDYTVPELAGLKDTYDAGIWNGSHYLAPYTDKPLYFLIYNPVIFEEYGLETPWELWEKGEWTWEAFEALCEKLTRDTDNDGVIDRYAMMSFSSHLIPAALVSNGAGFVQVDENGKYYNAAETDAFLEAMNWVMDMVSKYEMKAPEGAEWNYFESAFINGEVALQVHEDYFAGSLSNMEDDYGFVFFPKGPRVDTYLYAPSDNIMVIPACYDADRAWKIAFAYNLFTNPTPGYTDSDDWKNGYYQKYRDERAVDETIAMMREPEHQFVWYSDMVTGYDLGSQYIWDVYAQATTPAEKAESMRGTWQAYIDEANAN